jgi:hypothetical protein
LSPAEKQQIGSTSTRVWQILCRRRWIVGLLVLFLLVLAPVLWLMYRPHSGLERQLVGSWKNSVGTVITLHANRTFSYDDELCGSWSASGNTLKMRDLYNADEVLRVLLADGTVTCRVTHVSDSSLTFTVEMNGVTGEWQRVDTD